MRSDDIPSIELQGALDVRLPDGNLVRLRPGPYGKGISMVPLEKQETDAKAPMRRGQPGRRPRPSTVRLRQRLDEDLQDGGLGSNTAYVDWMLSIDNTLSLPVARQIVYRERKRRMDSNA